MWVGKCNARILDMYNTADGCRQLRSARYDMIDSSDEA